MKRHKKEKNQTCFPPIDSKILAFFPLRSQLCIHKSDAMEKIFEEICAIFTSENPSERKAMELRGLYSRLGRSSVILDNMLYDRLGLSCEDLIDMLCSRSERLS